MYNRILVAVDDSDVAQFAVLEAARLAKCEGSKLRLVHILDEGVAYWGAGGPILDTVFEAMRNAGQAVLQRAVAVAAGAGIEADTTMPETVGQSAANIIVEEAKRWSAHLIVIGTHGRRGLEHLLLGSVAEGVVRLSSVPVLLVRKPSNETQAAATK